MAYRVDLEGILSPKGVNVHMFNFPIQPNHLAKVAEKIGDWETCAHYLGVPQDDINDIAEENRKVKTRRIKMLYKWRQLMGEQATYSNLFEALATMGRRDVIEDILDLLCSKKIGDDSIIIVGQEIHKIAKRFRRTVRKCIKGRMLKPGKYISNTV